MKRRWCWVVRANGTEWKTQIIEWYSESKKKLGWVMEWRKKRNAESPYQSRTCNLIVWALFPHFVVVVFSKLFFIIFHAFQELVHANTFSTSRFLCIFLLKVTHAHTWNLRVGEEVFCNLCNKWFEVSSVCICSLAAYQTKTCFPFLCFITSKTKTDQRRKKKRLHWDICAFYDNSKEKCIQIISIPVNLECIRVELRN